MSIHGVLYRRLDSLGGELRAFTVSADSVEGAIAGGLSKIHDAGKSSEVESIIAVELGHEGTAEFCERHHKWTLEVLRHGGNVIHL